MPPATAVISMAPRLETATGCDRFDTNDEAAGKRTAQAGRGMLQRDELQMHAQDPDPAVGRTRQTASLLAVTSGRPTRQNSEICRS